MVTRNADIDTETIFDDEIRERIDSMFEIMMKDDEKVKIFYIYFTQILLWILQDVVIICEETKKAPHVNNYRHKTDANRARL